MWQKHCYTVTTWTQAGAREVEASLLQLESIKKDNGDRVHIQVYVANIQEESV